MRTLTIILSLVSILAFGQKQANIWYFGNYAGIDFNGGNPTALLDGQVTFPVGQSHNEGSSVISDSSGALLFYTDGMTVWNKNHSIMANGTGLLGNFSTTQSSIIVPDPASPDYIYYVFTVSSGFCCNGNISDGLRYSKVDICKNNLLGEVLLGEKNIKLVDSVSEKIAVTKHSNGIDYWVLTHKYFSNEFWCLHLTPNGITDTIISAIGSIHGGFIGGSQGQLKFSPNGQRIAIGASNALDILEVFDFDSNTGIVSNCLPLFKPNNNFSSVYGVEFSPDNSKLYARGNSSNGLLFAFLAQYDLNANGGNLADIDSSMVEIFHHSFGIVGGGGLQIAPDNKIYCVSQTNLNMLATINYPNLSGVNCDFQDLTVSLGGRNGSFSLPSFIAGFDYSNKISDCTTTSLPIVNKSYSFSLFPNPFDNKTVLTFDNPKGKELVFFIYDSLGKQVYSLNNIAANSISLERKYLPSGIYYYKLLSDSETIASGTLIVN